jgi:CubicO group peptidase (beta-lactamase class C family)
MKNYKLYALLVLLTLALACKNTPVIQTGSLPRSTPETEGVSSEALLTFLDSAASSEHEFHSIMILRHGKVIAEGWWSPYDSTLRHTLYSTSKSLTSTAVGFAVTEKLITVDDKVISFFPEDLPDTVSPYLAQLTIKDLLMMSAGQDPDPTRSLRNGNTNWVKAFLATPIINEPGKKFLYNSMATYMLSAIVQKVTGQKIVDYLTPRLFEPLGIKGMDWETDPKGINTGGWGLRIKTEDMAKFGQLLLQKGKWNGKEVIPEAWVDEATTMKIMQNPDARQSQKDSSDWLQGYCYQFWRCRNNAFRADGAYGQYIIVMPEKDAVVAITCESPNMQSEINLVWDYLLPAFNEGQLPENKPASDKLKERLASLSLAPASGSAEIPAKFTNPSEFVFPENPYHFKSINISLTDTCHVNFVFDSVEYLVDFGSGKWLKGETSMPGPSLTGTLPGQQKIAGSYAWKDAQTLELILRYIESPHHATVTCKFDRDKITVALDYGKALGQPVIELKGSAAKIK